MRKIYLEQGSEKWLDWRKTFLTATDAAIILGNSPYATPFKGWQRKVGQAPEQFVNNAMLRGQRDEPIARQIFIEQYGINMIPYCIESEIYNFLAASLDGISDCGKYILEIKSQRIEEIRANGVPNFHMDQMQHQMLCADNTIEKCFYVSIWDNEIYVIEVFPDLEWKKKYIPKAKDFWRSIVFFEPPQMNHKDYRNMNDITEFNEVANEYKKICDQLDSLEEMKQFYKKELIRICGEDSGMGAGLKVIKKFSKGRIDYKEVCSSFSLNENELEKFRKDKSESWAILVDKN